MKEVVFDWCTYSRVQLRNVQLRDSHCRPALECKNWITFRWNKTGRCSPATEWRLHRTIWQGGCSEVKPLECSTVAIITLETTPPFVLHCVLA